MLGNLLRPVSSIDPNGIGLYRSAYKLYNLQYQRDQSEKQNKDKEYHSVHLSKPLRQAAINDGRSEHVPMKS